MMSITNMNNEWFPRVVPQIADMLWVPREFELAVFNVAQLTQLKTLNTPSIDDRLTQ